MSKKSKLIGKRKSKGVAKRKSAASAYATAVKPMRVRKPRLPNQSEGSKTDLARVRRMNDAEINKGVDADPDAFIVTAKMVKDGTLVRRRGPQLAATKKQVTLRLDSKILDHYKAGGPGWQSRLNDDLMKAVKRKR